VHEILREEIVTHPATPGRDVTVKKLAATILATTLASVPCEVSAIAAENSRRLSGPKIREKLAGMQLTDEVHWRDVYNRDGTLRSYSDGKGRVGKWTVKKDELCIYFKEPDDGCYEVFLSGDRIEMKPSGLGLSIEGILQAPTDRN
jgi:hypothetical protein